MVVGVEFLNDIPFSLFRDVLVANSNVRTSAFPGVGVNSSRQALIEDAGAMEDDAVCKTLPSPVGTVGVP